METKPVFYDPKQTRQRRIRIIIWVTLVLFLIVGSGFTYSLLIRPHLPSISLRRSVSLLSKSPFSTAHEQLVRRLQMSRERRLLIKAIRAERKVVHRERPQADQPMVAAFYAPWQESGLYSLQRHADSIDVLMPVCLRLTTNGKSVDTSDWQVELNPQRPDLEKIARRHDVAIWPVISNSEGGHFDPKRVSMMLHDDNAQRDLINWLITWLKRQRYQGLNLDFENLYHQDRGIYADFVRKLSQQLHEVGLSLSVDIESTQLGDNSTPRISSYADHVVVMAYDKHFAGGKPGPIAPISWVMQLVHDAVQVIPAQKLTMGIGCYNYDWPLDGGTAEALSYVQAVAIARDASAGGKSIVDFDPESLNSTYSYKSDDDTPHEVWMQDAVSVRNQLVVAKNNHLGGVAFWVLGLEDPSMWTQFTRTRDDIGSADRLTRISVPGDVQFVGDGEVLQPESEPRVGHRSIDLDPTTGMITDMEYTEFPSSVILRRSGLQKHAVAITFDDGPSIYTGAILDELKKYHVPATFFVIGGNAEMFPDLLRRAYDDGHEIGNHTFTHPNMGLVSDTRARLELNATQRIIQSVTDHDTILFRPPYNADAEPRRPEEVRPILEAYRSGYVTVGEFIDPQDWNPTISKSVTNTRHRTPEDIASIVMKAIHSGRGNTILLHDGGGNRENTVKALRLILPQLAAEKFRFITASELLGIPRSTVMPAVSGRDLRLMGADRFVFTINYASTSIVHTVFVIGILLGVVRLMMLLSLAFIQRKREKRATVSSEQMLPVSVVVAAYNEETVIARTVDAIAASDYPVQKIVVVDDGSTDNTYTKLQQLAKRYANLSVLSQPNGGKASALNNAISQCETDIIISIDADTIIDPCAIRLMAQHFADAKVGAVAGNVRVGNIRNVWTAWQHLEYTTGQNLERRAWSVVNAITVVPGAIGAWRTSAVRQVGGYITDTMAEDMDLTWRVRMAGYTIINECQAIGCTEAPESVSALFRQRFRWAYGTLQCLWKHRRAMGHHGMFGRFVLPMHWIFQVLYQLFSPLVDLSILLSVIWIGSDWWSMHILRGGWALMPAARYQLEVLLVLGLGFMTFEMFAGFLALRWDKQKTSMIWLIPLQRLAYRQMLYGVVIKSVWHALNGLRAGWNKLERTGSVSQ